MAEMGTWGGADMDPGGVDVRNSLQTVVRIFAFTCTILRFVFLLCYLGDSKLIFQYPGEILHFP